MNFINNNTERNLIFYFQIHQPKRLRTFNLFDVGSGDNYFNNYLNNNIIQRAVHECYLPTNALLLRLIKAYPQIKVAFSISGVTLEQFEDEAPEVLESFKALAATGSVEFLAETYYHSLACLQDTEEFETQVVMHAEKIYEHFGKRPVVFRNTELVYNNDIGKRVSNMGFHGIFTDGIKRIMGQRSIHHLYNHPEITDFKILLRNFQLSDDIAFRFKDQALTVEKYIAWLDAIPQDDKLVNIAMDYETFGEHQKASSGIFNFLEQLLVELAHNKNYKMMLPSEAVCTLQTHETLAVPNYISWADEERDLSAWLGNDMQRDAYDSLMRLERNVKYIDDHEVLKVWRYLQTSDHFYYMSTKKNNDGVVHNYFSHYSSCYEAFINFMNVLTDFIQVVKTKVELTEHENHSAAIEAERRKISTPVWAMSMAAHSYH